MSDDLWPDDIGDSKLVSPVEILRAQAEGLAEKTGGLVQAEVSTQAINEEMFHNAFVLLVPALGDYRYELLEVRHRVSFYPLDVLPRAGHNLDNYMGLESERRFTDALKSLFGKPEVKSLIHSLVAQARAQA
jgi:hypothetical protein